MEEEKENPSKLKSLKKHLSLTLKRRKKSTEIIKTCNDEFDFVNFNTIRRNKAIKSGPSLKNKNELCSNLNQNCLEFDKN